MRKLINFIRSAGIIGLFAWISFFAAILTGYIWWFRFLFALVILLLLLACMDAGFYRKLIFSKEDLPLWIFLLTMAGGLVNATNRGVAYQHFWVFIFAIPFLYFFTKATFREEYGIILLRAICFMGLLVCIYGIAEFITRENFIYTNLINSFCYNAFKGKRMMSTQMHPAPLGTYLVAIFPLSAVLIFKEKKIYLRVLAIISAGVIFISIILTFSRGAFFGVFMAILTMLFFLFRRKKNFFISILILSALGITIIAISSLLFNYRYPGFYRFSLSGLSMPYYYTSKLERFISIGRILRDHPFFGVGFGHYRILFDYYLPHLAEIVNKPSKVPDCVYILLLTETGVIGFAGFVLFISFLFKKILCALKSLPKNEDKLLLVGFLSGFIGILCAFLTYDALYWTAPAYLFWSYAGILASLSGRAIKKNG